MEPLADVLLMYSILKLLQARRSKELRYAGKNVLLPHIVITISTTAPLRGTHTLIAVRLLPRVVYLLFNSVSYRV